MVGSATSITASTFLNLENQDALRHSLWNARRPRPCCPFNDRFDFFEESLKLPNVSPSVAN